MNRAQPRPPLVTRYVRRGEGQAENLAPAPPRPPRDRPPLRPARGARRAARFLPRRHGRARRRRLRPPHQARASGDLVRDRRRPDERHFVAPSRPAVCPRASGTGRSRTRERTRRSSPQAATSRHAPRAEGRGLVRRADRAARGAGRRPGLASRSSRRRSSRAIPSRAQRAERLRPVSRRPPEARLVRDPTGVDGGVHPVDGAAETCRAARRSAQLGAFRPGKPGSGPGWRLKLPIGGPRRPPRRPMERVHVEKQVDVLAQPLRQRRVADERCIADVHSGRRCRRGGARLRPNGRARRR